MGDYLSGTYGALGVLMAMRVVERTGEGQYIDIGLYEPVFRFLDEMASVYAHNGFVRERMGADTVNVVPHSHYPTKDGKWVAIACTNDRMFARLAEVMGQPELAAPERFGGVEARLEQRPEVNAIVTAWTSSLDQDKVLERCREGEVPSGPIHNVADIFDDPQYAARENLIKFPHEGIGELTMPGIVPKLSATPGRVEHLGPDLGEHNRQVLTEIAGLDSEEVDALSEKGVI